MKGRININYWDRKTALYHVFKYDVKRVLQYLVTASIVLFFIVAPDTELYQRIIELVQ